MLKETSYKNFLFIFLLELSALAPAGSTHPLVPAAGLVFDEPSGWEWGKKSGSRRWSWAVLRAVWSGGITGKEGGVALWVEVL